MENAHLLKEYFLPYAFCGICSGRYSDLSKKSTEIDSGEPKSMVVHLDHREQQQQQCDDAHDHIFTNLFIEQHMIPIIMQQFLIDLGSNVSKLTPNNYFNEHLDTQSIALNSIDLKEIEPFWNDYMNAMPSDLEMIWDTIDNGLVRYLQVTDNFN